jgi:hypothetical protein
MTYAKPTPTGLRLRKSFYFNDLRSLNSSLAKNLFVPSLKQVEKDFDIRD